MASSAERNSGDKFLPVFKSFSTRPKIFSNRFVMRGMAEKVIERARTNSLSDAFTTVLRGSPSSAAGTSFADATGGLRDEGQLALFAPHDLLQLRKRRLRRGELVSWRSFG